MNPGNAAYSPPIPEKLRFGIKDFFLMAILQLLPIIGVIYWIITLLGYLRCKTLPYYQWQMTYVNDRRFKTGQRGNGANWVQTGSRAVNSNDKQILKRNSIFATAVFLVANSLVYNVYFSNKDKTTQANVKHETKLTHLSIHYVDKTNKGFNPGTYARYYYVNGFNTKNKAHWDSLKNFVDSVYNASPNNEKAQHIWFIDSPKILFNKKKGAGSLLKDNKERKKVIASALLNKSGDIKQFEVDSYGFGIYKE